MAGEAVRGVVGEQRVGEAGVGDEELVLAEGGLEDAAPHRQPHQVLQGQQLPLPQLPSVPQQLAQLIQPQRAYPSNAKVIQTVDEMLQETKNIKR